MSLLRAKLTAMNSTARPIKPSRAGLSVLKSECPAPAGLLNAIDSAAISRMGFGGWPGPEGLLFLDTETTGLAGGAGTVVFLLGAGYIMGDRLVTEQFLLGDYCDEGEMLLRASELLTRYPIVVTFNGDAFDLPLLSSRATMNRVSLAFPASYDLIKPSRRLWKKRLGSVRLSVLEREVLRMGRTDDLPGSEAPKRFFDYLKTGDRALLDPVVEHNRLDVSSMAHLLTALIEAYSRPSSQADPVDLMSMARAMEKLGERGQAIACYNVASMPRSVNSIADLRYNRQGGEALVALGLIYKRMGEYERAIAHFRNAVLRESRVSAMVEIAKLLEHKFRDYDEALNWTHRAIDAERDEESLALLERRRARLLRKKGQLEG